ncbi:polysaccharide deacetylase family protein [Candidatus Pacearchaeota archaeon]|nr:polysaccharide deacetylase family protein [Candidatus Pacearchaeota archaeon]
MKIIFATLIILITLGMIQISYGVTESCQCVAFRFDDVQDYWLNNIQMQLIDTFQQKNASLTIGIIGHYIGNDQKLVNFIKEKIDKNFPELEIANHGWNHEHFSQFTENQQWILLHESNGKIQNLTGIKPSVFIAPYDAINNDTFTALKENNLEFISANETADHPPYPLSNTDLYRLPETAEIGNLNKPETAWETYPNNYTYAEILRSMTKYGYAIVMMHPQDFSIRHDFNYTNQVNQTQIRQLELLIDVIQNNGLKIVPMSKIPDNIDYINTYPKWMDNVFTWLIKNNVTGTDVINAINYLKNNQIITTQPKTSLTLYPVHQNITTTFFWIGEPASVDDQYTDNLSSFWDDKWVEHYGGVDNPNNRTGYFPAEFIPKENPFYFALPYSDFFDNDTRRSDAYQTVYWSHEKNWGNLESMVKNKWIKITKDDKTVYAQWEDAGPFVYDDKNYVFGTALPKNKLNDNAGLDVSPAVRDYIGLYDNNKNIVSWQFVDFDNVPDGPWKKIITTSQLYTLPH